MLIPPPPPPKTVYIRLFPVYPGWKTRRSSATATARSEHEYRCPWREQHQCWSPTEASDPGRFDQPRPTTSNGPSVSTTFDSRPFIGFRVVFIGIACLKKDWTKLQCCPYLGTNDMPLRTSSAILLSADRVRVKPSSHFIGTRGP